jgi:predicted Na+-dependent transporter
MSMAAAPAKKTSFWRTVKAVAWSFVGLRARGDYEEDVKNLNPLHIVAVGLIAVFVFVAALVLLVNWMVAR